MCIYIYIHIHIYIYTYIICIYIYKILNNPQIIPCAGRISASGRGRVRLCRFRRCSSGEISTAHCCQGSLGFGLFGIGFGLPNIESNLSSTEIVWNCWIHSLRFMCGNVGNVVKHSENFGLVRPSGSNNQKLPSACFQRGPVSIFLCRWSQSHQDFLLDPYQRRAFNEVHGFLTPTVNVAWWSHAQWIIGNPELDSWRIVLNLLNTVIEESDHPPHFQV